MQSREQKYAETIYRQVSQFKDLHPDESDKDRKRYGSMSHKLPILVRQAGLVQALAFVASRDKPPFDRLLTHLAETVGETDLLAQSRSADLTDYIYLTERVMLALKWYKRFAQSVLKVDPTDEDDSGGDNA